MDSKVILDRLRLYTNTRTDKQLAELLEMVPMTISTWRHRNRIDFEKIIDTFPEIDLNWLVKGDEAYSKTNINDTGFKVEETPEYKKLKEQNDVLMNVIDLLTKKKV